MNIYHNNFCSNYHQYYYTKYFYQNVFILVVYELDNKVKPKMSLQTAFITEIYSIFSKKFHIWKPPNQSEFTLFIFNTDLTHLGLETSILHY